MSLNFKVGLQQLLTLDKFTSKKKRQRLVSQGYSAKTLYSGTKIFHYTRENEDEKSRIHLRIDPDDTGTLIVNANRVMHLNPTAAFMAWLILEGKTKEERMSALTSRYSVSKKQAEVDLSSFLLSSTNYYARMAPALSMSLTLNRSCRSVRGLRLPTAWISPLRIVVTMTVHTATTPASATSLN